MKKILIVIRRYCSKGNILNELGIYEEAILLFNKAIETNSQVVDSYVLKGYSLSKLGKHEEAIKLYDKAIKIKPQDISIYRNKASSFLELKEFENAEKICRFALEMDSNEPGIHETLADIFSEEQYYKDAEKEYKIALKLENNSTTHNGLGVVYANLKKYTKAINEFKYSVKLDATNITAHKNLREMNRFYGDHRKSETVKFSPILVLIISIVSFFVIYLYGKITEKYFIFITVILFFFLIFSMFSDLIGSLRIGTKGLELERSIEKESPKPRIEPPRIRRK